MTVNEFSREFDIQYNSIATNDAPGLDLYEKSVYLTRAQLEIVKNYFNPQGNKYKKGFEGDSKRRYDLKKLVKTFNSFNNTSSLQYGIDDNSQFFDIPSNTFLIVHEHAISLDPTLCGNIGKDYNLIEKELTTTSSKSFLNFKGKPKLEIIPKTHDEYNVQKDNPFRKPNDKKAWRIDYEYLNSGQVEIISPYNIYAYRMRYVELPSPIILTDLDVDFPNENLTIYGENSSMTSTLDSGVHQEILDRAVELALVDYKPEQSLQMKTQLNLRNE